MAKSSFQSEKFPTGMGVGNARRYNPPKRKGKMATHKSTRLGAIDEGVGDGVTRYNPKKP